MCVLHACDFHEIMCFSLSFSLKFFKFTFEWQSFVPDVTHQVSYKTCIGIFTRHALDLITHFCSYLPNYFDHDIAYMFCM